MASHILDTAEHNKVSNLLNFAVQIFNTEKSVGLIDSFLLRKTVCVMETDECTQGYIRGVQEW